MSVQHTVVLGLVHEPGSEAERWEQEIAAFQEDDVVVAPNLPGRGAPVRPGSDPMGAPSHGSAQRTGAS